MELWLWDKAVLYRSNCESFGVAIFCPWWKEINKRRPFCRERKIVLFLPLVLASPLSICCMYNFCTSFGSSFVMLLSFHICIAFHYNCIHSKGFSSCEFRLEFIYNQQLIRTVSQNVTNAVIWALKDSTGADNRGAVTPGVDNTLSFHLRGPHCPHTGRFCVFLCILCAFIPLEFLWMSLPLHFLWKLCCQETRKGQSSWREIQC